MNRINRKLEYALIALKHMLQKSPGELCSAKEICNSYRTPFDATSRAMQKMAQQGLLKSEQGIYGGYKIYKDLKKVSLIELMNIVNGPMEIAKCIDESSKTSCDLIEECNIWSPIHFLNSELIEFYSKYNLHQLLISKNQKSTLDHKSEKKIEKKLDKKNIKTKNKLKKNNEVSL